MTGVYAFLLMNQKIDFIDPIEKVPVMGTTLPRVSKEPSRQPPANVVAP